MSFFLHTCVTFVRTECRCKSTMSPKGNATEKEERRNEEKEITLEDRGEHTRKERADDGEAG